MSVINQKRIAKNTAILYVRMLFIMVVSLYTSRVILSTLGEVDFGLYNVIGSIVVAFSFLNGVLSSACSRYYAIELGRKDEKALNNVFNLNIILFLILGVIIFILAETVGLWFMNHKMQIPLDRMGAAQWVYQCSVIAFVINMITTPYRSIVTAREDMKVHAYCSVVEAVLKLMIVYVLTVIPYDKLSIYAILNLGLSVGVGAFYHFYCRHYYKECRFSFYFERKLFVEIFHYTKWQVLGAIADIGKNSGINIILNMFFGALLNAARGIAYQVNMNINQFVVNFTMSFNPQIIKSYAVGETKEMMNLVFFSSKISYFLLFVLVFPVCVEIDTILAIWLGEVPDYTAIFCRLTLLASLVDSLSYSLSTAVRATGNVRLFQSLVSGTLLLAVPVAYVMYKWGGFEPASVFYMLLIISCVAQILRIYVMARIHKMHISEYIRQVIAPILGVTILSLPLPLIVRGFMDNSIWASLLVIIMCMVSAALNIFFVGLTATERAKLISSVKEGIAKVSLKK